MTTAKIRPMAESTGDNEPGWESDITLTEDSALAVYGTLRPGEVNAFVLLDMPGRWIDGFVRGYLYEITWGPAEGYPGLTLDKGGNLVPVSVLISDRWPQDFWKTDRFEGPGYQRRVTSVVDADDRPLGKASIYEALTHV